MAQISGTGGADVLAGAAGSDVFTGDAGHDIFVFNATTVQTDVITDFGATYFAGAISGSQEVPANASAGSGSLTGALNRAQTEFNFVSTITGLDLGGQTPSTPDNVIAAHFHRSVAGVAGGVVFGFIGLPNNEVQAETFVDPVRGLVVGSWDAAEGNAGTTLTSLVPALLNNEIYINFHTAPFPQGEIRGQALRQDSGLDRINLREAGIGDFAALQGLMREVGGSTHIALTWNGQANTLILTGAPMARLSASDFIFADEGRTQFGTAGADDIFGGSGADWLFGEAGTDRINAGAGGDTVEGRADGDVVFGMAGDDRIFGGDGADDVNGNVGADVVQGEAGADTVRGGQDDDTVSGGADSDPHVNGNLGADVVHGDAGADTVYGGQGADTVFGDDGDDLVSGDLGADILYGGAGADRFTLRVGGGTDWVGDFSGADGDRIQLTAGASFTMTSHQGQAMVTLSSGDSIGLAGVSASGFQADWVIFG